jgi:hypothetical protein
MLNKLNASDEMIKTLGEKTGWIGTMADSTKDELLAIVLTVDREIAERQQALIALLQRFGLRESETKLIHSLGIYQLSDILVRYAAAMRVK